MGYRRVAESMLEALEDIKPTSVVGVELQEVHLGVVAPQILGVEVNYDCVDSSA